MTSASPSSEARPFASSEKAAAERASPARPFSAFWPRNGRRTAGRILFEGRDLCALSERELETIRGKGIGMVFQDPLGSLNPRAYGRTAIARDAHAAHGP